MSSHPNALMLIDFSPHDLPRKTYLSMVAKFKAYEGDDSPYVPIGPKNGSFHMQLMESSYAEGSQIRATQGNIVFWCAFTYGYGERMPWDDVMALHKIADEWAKVQAAEFKCDYKIDISANYW